LSLEGLSPEDKYLTEILKKFHGQLFMNNEYVDPYFCNAFMLYLEKDEHNIDCDSETLF